MSFEEPTIRYVRRRDGRPSPSGRRRIRLAGQEHLEPFQIGGQLGEHVGEGAATRGCPDLRGSVGEETREVVGQDPNLEPDDTVALVGKPPPRRWIG